MNDPNRDRTPADLVKIAERLRDERTLATPLELDRIKLRARSQAERSGASFYATQKGKLMKSRLALGLMIVAGLMMSTTGATLAVSGLSDSGSAGSAQYPNSGESPNGEQGATLPTEESGGPGGGEVGTSEVQPTRQVSNVGDESLPFTGFLAIPVLIGGVGLLGAGVVLRRRGSDRSEDLG